MNAKENLVRAVMQAADGEVVGRIRLQKIFYLLEQLGVEGGLRFSYYHYGPYSRELSDTLDELEIDGTVEEENVPIEGGSYSVYRLKKAPGREPSSLGRLPWEQLRKAIAAMKDRTSPVIELAATIHWLREKERVEDWRKELKVRKPQKATDARIGEAETLLRQLGLAA